MSTRTNRYGRLLSSATAGALALGLSGCGLGSLTSGLGGGLFGGGDASAKTAGGGVTQEALLSAAKADGATASFENAAGCPRVTIATRDSNVSIFDAGRVGDALGVQHRGEITKTARECNIDGARVTVKYGFSGRVLLGPRGKTGNVQLPLTVTVMDSAKQRIAGERLRIDVPVALDKPIGYFSTVREISFVVPEGARAGEFELFVGFDRTIPNAG